MGYIILLKLCVVLQLIVPVMKKLKKRKKVGLKKSKETRWDETIILNYSDK